ncbi:MAG: hypothetical protein KAT43_04760 [Nanoarchaeota archaeon]|nr:hypothetical protein [Nanoarchaeota archaeon]
MVAKLTNKVSGLEEGDSLKYLVLSELKKADLDLSEKHEGICSDDMPKIQSMQLTKESLELTVGYEGKAYAVHVQPAEEDIVRYALAFLFGDGNVRYDYHLPVFQCLRKEDVMKFKRLAVEIWERNIHIDWMRKNNYLTHNGSKDYKFLFDMINNPDNPRIAADDHNLRSDRGDKGDTPHHSLREYSDFKEVLQRDGEDPRTYLLKEIIHDQATATVRIWYHYRAEPFDKRLNDNMEQGIYFKNLRWNLNTDKTIKTDLAKKTWKDWHEIHEKFRRYWKDKFGEKEELWQPPALYVVKGSKYKIV